MNALIRNNITFKNCYLFLILDILLIVPVGIMTVIAPQFETHVEIISAIISFILTLYIYMGYIKYSYIADEKKFRKIILIVIAILFGDFIFSLIETKTKFNSQMVFNYLSLMPLSYPLLFYGFKLIRNGKVDIFKRLSRLNLYLFVLIVFSSVTLLIATKSFTESIQWIILLPFLLAVLIIAILLIYWELKLFKYLSTKYDHLFIPKIEKLG